MGIAAAEVQSEAPIVMGPILFTKIELVLGQKGQRTFHFENSMPLKKNYFEIVQKGKWAWMFRDLPLPSRASRK